MSFLRDLRSELVEKRLWPVALLLIAALVAVPLVLAKSAPDSSPSQPDPVAAASAPADPPATAVPAVSLATTPGKGARLRGHAKNPFRQQHVPPKPSTATSKATGAGGTTTSGAGSGGATSPAHAHSKSPSKTYLTASVDVNFGKSAGDLKLYRDLAKLTLLPSASNPIAVFLGVRSGQKTAVFLISTDTHAQGDGSCSPSPKDCEKVTLKEGDVEILDFTGANGAVTEYELDLVKLTIKQTNSKQLVQSAGIATVHTARKAVRKAARKAARSARAHAAIRASAWGSLTPIR